MPPFLILALPRSRTVWLSHLLTYGPARCEHDFIAQCGTINQFVGAFGPQGLAGSCETAAMLGWKVIKLRMPTARLVLVRRPLDEVAKSLRQACLEVGIDLPVPMAELELRDSMLDALARVPGVKSFDFIELEDEQACKWIFEHCLETQWDREHWQRLAQVNIQVDLRARFEYLASVAPRLEALRREVIFASTAIQGGPSWLGLN